MHFNAIYSMMFLQIQKLCIRPNFTHWSIDLMPTKSWCFTKIETKKQRKHC